MRKFLFLPVYIFVILVFTLSPLAPAKIVNAASMIQKSVTIGDSVPSSVTSHNFAFTLQSVGNVGSIVLEYCTNTPFVGTACTAPGGLDVSAANLASQAGEVGFIIDPINTTANKLVLSRPSVAAGAVPVTYNFDNITNPSPPNNTVYVRLSTHASIDGTGPTVDEGAVAFATTSNITINGYVPPYITFCVGVTVALNCSSSSGVLLDFGELVVSQTRAVSSMFSVATNDPGGYATFLAGTTMTGGNNTIPGVNPQSISKTGVSQFGLNLRANSAPSIGAEPSGVGTGAIAAGFNTPNQYFFNNQVLVSSPISSDFNAFTVSYIANISTAQPAGIYSTTITYIATAAF